MAAPSTCTVPTSTVPTCAEPTTPSATSVMPNLHDVVVEIGTAGPPPEFQCAQRPVLRDPARRALVPAVDTRAAEGHLPAGLVHPGIELLQRLRPALHRAGRRRQDLVET